MAPANRTTDQTEHDPPSPPTVGKQQSNPVQWKAGGRVDGLVLWSTFISCRTRCGGPRLISIRTQLQPAAPTTRASSSSGSPLVRNSSRTLALSRVWPSQVRNRAIPQSPSACAHLIMASIVSGIIGSKMGWSRRPNRYQQHRVTNPRGILNSEGPLRVRMSRPNNKLGAWGADVSSFLTSGLTLIRDRHSRPRSTLTPKSIVM